MMQEMHQKEEIMTIFFNQLLQNSMSAAILILAILLFRKITGELSKLYVHILWLITMLVLVLPPVPLGTLHTPRSLLAETEFTFSVKQPGTGPETETEDPAGAEAQNESAEAPQSSENQALGDTPENFLHRGQGIGMQSGIFEPGVTEIFLTLWAFGATALTAAVLAEWLHLKKRITAAVRIQKDVWSTAQISTPFVMPGLPSRIYIPEELEKEKEQLEDILKHERRHIRSRDPWIKCLAVLVLILHWFNPFVWLAFRLMNRDMEMYCDECVLRGKSIEEKKHYAQTLLNFACKSRGFTLAVCFGESNTKKRIRHILNTKRPHAAVSILLLFMVSGCGLSFLDAGENEPGKAVVDVSKEELLPDALSGGDTADADEGAAESGGEEKHWTEKDVVGTGRSDTEPGFDAAEMSLMGETEQFAVYSMREGEAMAVKTPECLVLTDVPPISNYEIAPLLLEQDFDGDGETELAIITYVLHGTGISIRSLFMTDHTSDGSWKIYQYLDEDYMAELTQHYGTLYTEEGVRLTVDGVPVGIAEEVEQEDLDNEYGYYAGSLIDFWFVEEKIYLRSELLGYSDIKLAGQYPGHELDARVNYLGEGKWQLTDINYADAGITEVIEYAVPRYLAGQTSEINEQYTVPGTQLSDFGEPQEIAILSITYPAEDVAGEAVEAYVTIRRDGEDALDYLHVPLKRIPLETGGFGWRIAGEIYMER